MKEYDLALKILKNLKLSEDTYTSYGKSNRVQKERLNNILLALFTFNSIEKYLVKKDSDTAFNLLKECEKIFQDNHKFSFKNYLTLSRIYYEKGEISLAYIYTEKAMKISRNCSSIYCNLGFFGMIENNIDQVYTNYRELAHVYKFKKTLNFIDVIHFIELHKSKHSESIDLFEFAIATLNFLYVDKILGRKQLNDLKEKLKENKEYLKINSLIDFFLTKGSIKSPYFQRDKKRKYIQK